MKTSSDLEICASYLDPMVDDDMPGTPRYVEKCLEDGGSARCLVLEALEAKNHQL